MGHDFVSVSDTNCIPRPPTGASKADISDDAVMDEYASFRSMRMGNSVRTVYVVAQSVCRSNHSLISFLERFLEVHELPTLRAAPRSFPCSQLRRRNRILDNSNSRDRRSESARHLHTPHPTIPHIRCLFPASSRYWCVAVARFDGRIVSCPVVHYSRAFGAAQPSLHDFVCGTRAIASASSAHLSVTVVPAAMMARRPTRTGRDQCVSLPKIPTVSMTVFDLRTPS